VTVVEERYIRAIIIASHLPAGRQASSVCLDFFVPFLSRKKGQQKGDYTPESLHNSGYPVIADWNNASDILM